MIVLYSTLCTGQDFQHDIGIDPTARDVSMFGADSEM